jgi:DNA-binding response OmpR family regulator
VEIWQEWSPHLIWMDMRMPVMDGYEATRRIKSATGGQATVIIALTASGLEEDRSIILSEGCDDYIRKPFHEDELFAAIARHLGARYVYEEFEPQETTPAGAAQPWGERAAYQDLSARLSNTDPAWLERLERATVLGDQEIIIDLLNEIVEQDPHLAAGIAGLAEKFDHDRILFLIQKTSTGGEHAARKPA